MNLSIGKRIQSLRKQKGMSQQDLSDHLGITRQAISKWELDQTLPDLETLVKMSELFHVSINELIGVKENEKSVSEAYDQIQIVLQNIERQNKKRNIIEIILISFLITCLLLTNIKFTNKQPIETNADHPPISESLYIKEYHEFFNTPNLNEHFLIGEHYNSYSLSLTNFELSRTNFNVEYFNLLDWEVGINYSIYLNEYSEDTQISIEFNNGIMFDFEKLSTNMFRLKEEIPLLDYEYATIKIRNLSGKTIIEKVENINYLTYALQCQILLYLPAYNQQTQLDKLYYVPYFNNSLLVNGCFNGEIEGNLKINFYDENHRLIGDAINIDLASKGQYDLTEALPTNKKIYVTMDYNVHKKDSKHQYYGSLHSINEKGQSETYFIIDDLTKDYDIGFRKQN